MQMFNEHIDITSIENNSPVRRWTINNYSPFRKWLIKENKIFKQPQKKKDLYTHLLQQKERRIPDEARIRQKEIIFYWQSQKEEEK